MELQEVMANATIASNKGEYTCTTRFTCPVCGDFVYHKQKFCGECGSKMIWKKWVIIND